MDDMACALPGGQDMHGTDMRHKTHNSLRRVCVRALHTATATACLQHGTAFTHSREITVQETFIV